MAAGPAPAEAQPVALAFGGLFIVIVLASIAAPLWADHVAHTDPFKNHLTEQIKVGGELKDVVAPGRRADRADVAGALLPRRRRQRP